MRCRGSSQLPQGLGAADFRLRAVATYPGRVTAQFQANARYLARPAKLKSDLEKQLEDVRRDVQVPQIQNEVPYVRGASIVYSPVKLYLAASSSTIAERWTFLPKKQLSLLSSLRLLTSPAKTLLSPL